MNYYLNDPQQYVGNNNTNIACDFENMIYGDLYMDYLGEFLKHMDYLGEFLKAQRTR